MHPHFGAEHSVAGFATLLEPFGTNFRMSNIHHLLLYMLILEKLQKLDCKDSGPRNNNTPDSTKKVWRAMAIKLPPSVERFCNRYNSHQKAQEAGV